MKVKVIAAHQSLYPQPITFRRGDTLQLGRIDDEYPNWIRVITADGNEGWAPLQFIERLSAEQGRAICQYSAFELNTEVGEVLVAQQHLNDWYLATNALGVTGWVPAKTVTLV
ncbi:SH3 domain-containing protein [Gallaecimonas mangrovi]|uniref:SH3 domain-containing protein n=1 Tax=Gallaecimonas mangrovi TaxID=2291597 RepID=UPI000E203680|nr:SH3 domain-containing protein [Gallaecimonas mangrovi]